MLKFNGKSARFAVAVAVFLLSGVHLGLAQVRDKTAAKTTEAQVQIPPIDDKVLRYYKLFLDKDGGYKNKKGGYYDVKAGTYTDEHGGVVDNWGGYTYKSGSYKSKLGDFYDANENTFRLADGEVVKVLPGVTPAQAIGLLRENVEQNGGYDKDLTRRSMLQSIKADHLVRSGDG